MDVRTVPIAEEHIEGFRRCLDEVARERRYLAFLQAPPVEAVQSFVMNNIEEGHVQLVALHGDEVVGWCDILPRTSIEGFRHVGVLGMGVRAPWRSRRVGRRLLAEAVAGAREKGFERIELEVYASNSAARTLYEKFGFVTEGVKVKARKLDGEYDDIVLMALFL